MRPHNRSKLASYLFYIPFALPLWKLFKGSSAAVADLRREYKLAELHEDKVARDPIKQFGRWFDEALAAKLLETNAMTLATANERGETAARTVLLKGFDADGFVFYTNYESRKGRHLKVNPRAALLFGWYPLERQVEVRGRVEQVTREETEVYFHTRPIASQLGAWASRQSEVLRDRTELEERIQALMVKYRGKTIPVPPHWGGYRVIPETIEFWQGRPSRLHDRLRYSRSCDDAGTPVGEWRIERLSP